MAGCDESGETRHRLFLAICLGDEAKAAIGAWAKSRAGEFGNARLSWVSPSLYHLTLHFFGEVSGADAAAIAAGLEPLAGKVAAPALSPLGLDCLPSRRAPRVLCLGVRVEPEGALDAVIGTARRLAAEVGAENDGRPWRAHLTLGRFREFPRSAAALPPGEAPLGEAPELGLKGLAPESFDLMESFLSPRGPRYETLRRFPFAAPRIRAASGAAEGEAEGEGSAPRQSMF
ncbi:RNA 2',3'-cyclic phosphodiesterase [bacterium]|nr:RNA 2',3'-cyclic phosphodiesterase [bacterium]